MVLKVNDKMEISGWIHVSSYRFGTVVNKLILSILVCFILLVPTKSYSMDGNKWLEICQSEEAWAIASCTVYLVGFKDMEHYKNIMNNDMLKIMKERGILSERNVNAITEISASLNFCLPKEVIPSQLKKVVINWLEKNPGKLHDPLIWSFFASMQENFPCKN